ncbi:Cfr10I/Bse634I family restriction endonuclease [Fortiea contorta]|uniref:Cfr10I/Bse634I family restriction endonuclease n=1 Tax=Fortiea contorta TaxID=1892405 RepID=UPI00034955E1|nr:Cfr10I/Bse634I family restriction endonuclease [Fortiea contorta]
MPNDTEWFTETSNGKFRINSRAIYRNLSSEIVTKLDQNLSVSEILDSIRTETSKAFREKYLQNPQVGALNKATGGWNELIATSLLSEIVLNINQQNGMCVVAFCMPNSKPQIEGADESYSNFFNLFSKNEFTNENNALAKIIPFKDNIFMPSPDYIIAVINNKINSKIVNSLLEKQARDPDSLALYNFLKGKLHIEEVKAAVSLKTSNRPDRRYQPLFEAAMIKAMGYVLQQRWRYYMVVSELTPTDRTIFTTAIAPHGVALEQNFNLVDGTYLYYRKADLVPLVLAAIQN